VRDGEQSIKEDNMRRLLGTAVILIVIGMLLFTAGCNTWKGMGKDVEGVGDKMQE
jgi:predicted small secreted protein